jgi:hypothetical protein
LLDFRFKGTLRCDNGSGSPGAIWRIVSGNSATDNVGRWTIIKNSNCIIAGFTEDFDAEVATIAGSVGLFADVVNDKGSVRLGTDTVNGVASFKLVKRLLRVGICHLLHTHHVFAVLRLEYAESFHLS